MRIRRNASRWLRLLAPLGVAVPMLALSVPSSAAPPAGLPPGLRPIERNLSAQTGLEQLVFGESQIAVNPTNPNNIVYVSLTHKFSQACTSDPTHPDHPLCEEVPRFIPGVGPIGNAPLGFFEEPGFAHNTAFVSFNKGRSWRAVDLPLDPWAQCQGCDVQGDPSITVTDDGTFVYVFDAINWGEPQSALPNGGIGASVSHDGGLTWSEPVLTQNALDGPKVIADPNTGRVYAHSSGSIGTRLATGNPNDPVVPPPTPNDRYVAASDDGVNWTTPRRFGGSTFSAVGGLTAAHGVIATATRLTSSAACSFFVGGPAPCVVFSTSDDDGATWTRHNVPAPDLTPPVGVPPGGGGILVAADPSTPGHFTIAGFRPLSQGGGFTVYQTEDSGQTWTGPAIVNDNGPALEKARAAMAYSLDGTLGLMWRAYTTASSPPCQICAPFNVYATISEDGGATFAKAIKVNAAPSPKPPPGFHDNADHYSHIAFGQGRVYVSWADSRSPERAAYFGEIKLAAFFHPRNR